MPKDKNKEIKSLHQAYEIALADKDREIEERTRKIFGLMADFASHEKEIAKLKAERDEWKKCAEAHINFDREQTIHDEENND